MIFGWSDEHILNMPAKRFFNLVQAGRKIKFRDKQVHYLNLCDIQSISIADAKHYENIRLPFYNRAIGNDANKRPGLDPSDPRTNVALGAMLGGNFNG